MFAPSGKKLTAHRARSLGAITIRTRGHHEPAIHAQAPMRGTGLEVLPIWLTCSYREPCAPAGGGTGVRSPAHPEQPGGVMTASAVPMEICCSVAQPGHPCARGRQVGSPEQGEGSLSRTIESPLQAGVHAFANPNRQAPHVLSAEGDGSLVSGISLVISHQLQR